MDKSLLNQEKSKNYQSPILVMQRVFNTAHPTNVKKLIKEYYRQYYANQPDSLNDILKYPEKHELPNLALEVGT